MEHVPVFVGLNDRSKSVQGCVVDREGTILVNRNCGHSVLEVGAAIGPGRTVRRVAIESCGGAADVADALIADRRWPVSLAHPGYAPRMKHNPDKTDSADERLLAERCRAVKLREWRGSTLPLHPLLKKSRAAFRRPADPSGGQCGRISS